MTQCLKYSLRFSTCNQGCKNADHTHHHLQVGSNSYDEVLDPVKSIPLTSFMTLGKSRQHTHP
jgi:hypothetical protein